MEIKSAFVSGLLGIQRGMGKVDRSAATLASAEQMTEHNTSPERPLVESKVGLLEVELNLKSIETSDEALGSLLDEKA